MTHPTVSLNYKFQLLYMQWEMVIYQTSPPQLPVTDYLHFNY